MRIIAVLDVRAGRAVHAYRGERNTYAPVSSYLIPGYSGDPRGLAQAYENVLGIRDLYIADLDAILGGVPQYNTIQTIVGDRNDRMATWVDGGVSSAAHARATVEHGADRVIVGLETLPSLTVLGEIVDAVGDSRVVFSIDLRAGEPMTRASDLAGCTPLALAERAVHSGVRSLILLDLARVGTGRGVDLDLVRLIRRTVPELELVVGGGIGGGDDLERLARAGAHGALVASALHDGRIGAREIATITRQ